ncbi:MAG: hypothetical protein IK990_16515, partial [Ruminiclostridium sp.]|nr:hypothetical protein [Ruminiclostridium sp.]
MFFLFLLIFMIPFSGRRPQALRILLFSKLRIICLAADCHCCEQSQVSAGSARRHSVSYFSANYELSASQPIGTAAGTPAAAIIITALRQRYFVQSPRVYSHYQYRQQREYQRFVRVLFVKYVCKH